MEGSRTRLTDRHGRTIDYLRISLTDRCDLRCRYCLPRTHRAFVPTADWLRLDEIERLVRLVTAAGVRRVRLTGGEPLLRPGIVELAGRLRRLPDLEDLSLSTNATRLAALAGELRRAGVDRLNVSLDTLSPERFRAITGFDRLGRVLDGLMAAKAAGFTPIKLNMVPLAGDNDDEVDDMVAFCLDHGFVLRLIEVMPVGSAASAVTPADVGALRERLRSRFGLVDGLLPGGGPARYLRSRDGRFSVGFITPLSQHFCDTCNRLRLTADGALHLCLGREARVDLRGAMRSGASDAELMRLVADGVERKPWRHDFGQPALGTIRVMAATGG